MEFGGCDIDNGNCNNTDGSYYCICDDGFELLDDEHTCNGTILLIFASYAIEECLSSH